MPARTEELAGRMMAEILADRQFQRFWTDETAEVMNVQRSVNETPAPPSEFDSRSGQSVEAAEVENSFELLVRALQLATETFLRSVQMGDRIERFNCEAATLYSARVQLDRFIASDSFVHPKFLFVSRRLGHLIKIFTVRVSSAFDIPTMSFFACSLCEMLYRLEEFVSIHRPTSKSSLLQRATDDFYNNVVKTMNKLQLQRNVGRWQSAQSLRGVQFSALSHAQTGGTSTPPASQKSPAIFYRKSYSDPRSKSFFLPADLAEARHRLRQNAARSSAGGSRTALIVPPTSTTPHRPSPVRFALERPLSRPEIEERWAKLMQNDRLLQKLIEKNPRDREAFRMACEITREVVDDLEKQVHLN